MRIARFGLLLLTVACSERDGAEPKPPKTAPGDLLAGVNALRSKQGLPALARDAALERAAQAHAEEMARLNYFGHYSPVPENRNPDDRVRKQGWPEGLRYHELLSIADSWQSALESWTGKPKEKGVLADPECRVAGWGGSGRCWVLLLGTAAP